MIGQKTNSGFLGASEPQPFEIKNGSGSSPVFLTCEHAGSRIPSRLGDLGVEPAEMERHIAYDLGAEALARGLSDALDAPLVIQPYSRLVIDCNRPFAAPDCIAEISDGTVVPANQNLSHSDREARWQTIHQPYHAQIEELLNTRITNMLVAVHSFTPRLNEIHRPWHAGLLYNRDATLARRLMAELRGRAPELHIEFNEPYCIEDISDYTIPVHGERRSIPHVLLEIHNDELASAASRARWTELLAVAIAAIVPATIDEAGGPQNQ